MDFSKNDQGSAWKHLVQRHFSEIKFSPESSAKLENLLLSADFSDTSETQKNSTVVQPNGAAVSLQRSFFSRLQRWGLGYVLSAVAAAGITFVVVEGRQEDPQDPIAELTSQPGSRYYPPDFDLEGDASALKDILTDVFAEQNFFAADIPKNIQALYSPSEGRFFSWDGEPAVSIQLQSSKELPNSVLNPPATLYIVKLSTKSAGRFPKEKLTKRIASKAGKMKKVNVWREGKYGYAMVQLVAVNE